MFIRIEDKVINTNLIECVLPNIVVVERGKEFHDEDKTAVKGISIWMVGGENGACFTFENITLDDFMGMVK